MACGTNAKGLSGTKECRKGSGEILMKNLVFATEDQQFETSLAAGLKSNWLADIAAKKLFPAKNIKRIEDASKEASVEEYQNGEETEWRKGKRGFTVYFDLTLEDHQILQDYINFSYYYPSDEKGNIRVTSNDGTIIKPIKISSVQALMLPLSTGAAPLSALKIIEADYQDYDVNGKQIRPYDKGDAADRWHPDELDSVGTVQIEQSGSISANSCIVDVHYKSTSTYDANGDPVTDKPIEGLLVANFSILDGSGAVVTPLTAVESSTVPGRYTLTFTTFTAGSAAVVATSAALVESERLTLV